MLTNELSKWSVATIKILQVSGLSGEGSNSSDGETAVRFEFDFNTADSHSVPESIDVYHILRQLFDRSVAVSRLGAK